jgi:hypothetical protein
MAIWTMSKNTCTFLALLMTTRVRQCNTERIAQWMRSMATLEATGNHQQVSILTPYSPGGCHGHQFWLKKSICGVVKAVRPYLICVLWTRMLDPTGRRNLQKFWNSTRSRRRISISRTVWKCRRILRVWFTLWMALQVSSLGIWRSGWPPPGRQVES